MVNNIDIFNSLNNLQREAVKKINGPCRIIAGPGSGKTRTIISKIEYLLLEKHINPDRILVITFTNKAANEIKKRMKINGVHDFVNVFTYHGLAFRFLKQEIQNIYNDSIYFSIIDTKEQEDLILNNIKLEKTQLLEKNEKVLNFDIKELKTLISKIRFDESFLDLENKNLKQKEFEYFSSVRNIYNRYDSLKKINNFYDFDDLLFYFHKYLREFPDLKERWSKKYDYFFIDEFQDTNDIQYEIIKQITNKDSNITVVGDPDQNIYSWRGANINIILNFDNDYQNVETIILNKNYRSIPKIVKTTNNLINNNKNRVEFDNEAIIKPLSSDEGVFILEQNNYSRQIEANNVAYEIEKLHKNKGIVYDEIAIIYRSNYISREFETALLSRGIKYRIIGGFKFFDRKEVKEVLNFFKFLLFQDNFSLQRIINVPLRGVGPKTFYNYSIESAKNKQTIWKYINSNGVKVSKNLQNFIKITNKFLEKITNSDKDDSQIDIGDILKNYLISIDYFHYYDNPLNQERLDNINSMIKQIKEQFFGISDIKSEANNFFNKISLYSSADDEKETDHVTLITAHASKGTEYECVFFVGFNDSVIPSNKSVSSKKAIEEERRVAYVGLTRAKRYLYISYSTGLNYLGQFNSSSRFLEELKITDKLEINDSNDSFDDISKLILEGYDKDNKNPQINNMVFHKTFGKGLIIKEDDNYITVAFKKAIGVKDILKNHPSWLLKR